MATINRCNTQVTAYSTGEMIYTLQPACSAYNDTDRNNVTGDGTPWVIISNVEDYDINDDYNTSTYIWTAPVSGRYFLVAGVYFNQLSASTNEGLLEFVATGGTYNVVNWNPGSIRTGALQSQLRGSVIIEMDAGDEVYTQTTVSGSTLTVDVANNNGTLRLTYFAAQLLG